jgi:Na+/H+ antiporter NhaA
MGLTKEKDFWVATAILIATISLMPVVILHMMRFNQIIGPFRLSHWFVLIGATYVAFAVPIIAVLKKRHPQRYKTLLRTHVFGNLLAFMLVSLHFVSQISRPATSYPSLGTGLVLYIAMLLLVGTGFLQRFQLTPNIKPQFYRFIHVSSAFAFYLIIVVHILHGLAII